MEMTKQEKLKLIHYFEFALQLETSKPVDEMDGELIKAYVDVLLDLQDMHVELSPEFIDEQVRKIFHPEDEKITAPETEKQKKKVVNKKKIWLVAACIAILVALFSVASFSFEKSVVDVLEDFFGTYEFIPFGKELDSYGETYGKGSDSRRYETVEEAVKNEKIVLLYPTNISEIAEITMLSFFSKQNKNNVIISFDKSILSINIVLNEGISEEIKSFCEETIIINNKTCYLCFIENSSQVQAYFTHNNNLYTVTYTDREALIDILENMEEVKYED